MSETYVDPDSGDYGQGQQSGWMDSVKKTLGGLFSGGEEKPRPPAIDMARWGPVLKSAGLDEKSPEHQLLAAIAGHVNSAPIPREPSMGQKLMGTGLNAAAAGFLRSAGASPTEAIAPATSMVKDWQNRRDMADDTRLKAWQTGGSLMIPQVSGAVQAAQAQKRLEQTANLQARNYGLPTPYPSREAGAAPQAQAGAPATAAPLPQVPGIAVGDPAKAAPAGAPPAVQQPQTAGDPERPHAVGNVRFHTPEWAGQFQRGLQALLMAPGASTSIPVTDKNGVTTSQEIKTPADLERVALQEDAKAYQGTTQYKAKEAATLKETEGVVANNQEQLKGYQTAARAAQTNNNVIGLMDQALSKAQSSGQLGVGTGNMVLGPINAILERMGAPHLQQGALTMIKELQNRAGVEAANEEVNSGRGPGQKIMQTFLNAVPGADMTESGFVAASAAIKAINAYHVATGRLAEELMKEPGSHSRRDLQSEVAKRAQPAFEKAVKAAQAAIDSGVAPKPGQQQGAGAPAMSREDAKAAARALIAKDPTLSADAAMKQVMGSGAGATSAAPGAAPAAPAATGGAPQRPPQSGLMQKVWDWSYPEQAAAMAKKRKQQEEDLGRIGALRPMGPR